MFLIDTINPFIIGTDIPDEYFCDRETETAKLIGYIANGNNVVLKAPRRIGKTSLLFHLFRQPEIAKRYNTLMVDLYMTKDESDFIREFSKAFLNAPFAQTEKGKKAIHELFPEIRLYANLNLGLVNAGAEAKLRNEYDVTLEKMFSFLERTDKPNLVVFDEFQTIEEYPEKMSAVLRAHIQKMKNTRFIFSGSERHLLASMFNEANKPFYKMALPMELDIIPAPTYQAYCTRLFEQRKRHIQPEAIAFTYALFTANTYEMQQVMNLVFSFTGEGRTADEGLVKDCIQGYLADNDAYYRKLLAQSKSVKERNLLQCLATESVASEITSQAMIAKYNLGGPSSVQASIKKLMDLKRAVVSEVGMGHYRLQDKFFELWLCDAIGILDLKYEKVHETFRQERSLLKDLPRLTKKQ